LTQRLSGLSFTPPNINQHPEPSTVAVAMSGGIDSAVAALLLSSAGWTVKGIHFLMPAPPSLAEERQRQATRIADLLGLPLETVDLKDSFHRKVIVPFILSYRLGETPNPCVVCNAEIKFKRLSEFALEQGIRFIATGHYAISSMNHLSGGAELFRGADPSKDQSYFLHRLTGNMLKRVLFPLGRLTKHHVREIADAAGILQIPKGESRDVCFLGDGDYRLLVERNNHTGGYPGEIVDTSGKTLGIHKGIHRYTIGQRHGLGIAHHSPLYVIELLPEKNQVMVGLREELLRREVSIRDWSWIDDDKHMEELRCKAQIRYRHREASGVLKALSKKRMVFTFDDPQRAVTPGQALVCYLDGRVIGGGWIERPAS
jgi:tRNA-specific 2-thiouridylase